MSREFPTFHEAYQAACAHGDMLDGYDHMPHQTKLTFPVREEIRLLSIDRRMLRASGMVYADGVELIHVLAQNGALRIASLGEAVGFLEDKYRDTSRIVLGFCGFTGSDAAAEDLYSAEASAIQTVYQMLEGSRRTPVLSSDGAMRTGILGLSTLIAQSFFVPTLGYTPLQGLKKIAPHGHLVVSGNTYQDRQKLVGVTPDLLIAMGGKDEAENECLMAVENGSVVLQLNARDYDEDTFPHTYQNVPRLVEAERDGQFIVCPGPSELRATLKQAVDRTMDQAVATRPTRLEAVSDHMRGGLGAAV